MFGQGLDAAEAAFRLGYESPSQSGHKYLRMFGSPTRQAAAAVEAQST
jgi:hypothetical protein